MASKLPFKLSNPDLLQTESYVHGGWKSAQSGKRFDIEDPGTGKVFASCPDCDESDVDAIVESAHEAFQTYRRENPRSRAKKLLEWDRLIRQNRDDLASVLTHESGKPLAEAQGELDYALGFTWWFAGEAERIRGTVSTPSAPGRRVLVVKQPIGVAVALVPWNFPVAMILRKAGAALAAGCTMIAKPSPETPLTCLILANLATQAGFGPGVFNVVTTSLDNTPEVAEALCKHPLTKKVSFTGSTAIGSLIAKHCSEGLKKVTLELGGNCPFVVFDDCNQTQALEALLALKWRHAGQACITANRVYVQDGIYEEFLEKLVERTKAIKLGHGSKEDTTMGPLTTPRAIPKAQAHVKDAVKAGAKIVYGGKTGAEVGLEAGYFHEPTILRDMKQSMLISREETFAPVLGVYRFKTEDEAVEWANDTGMGLASYFFTKDIDRTWRLMENLDAGMIGMNTGNSSAAETPFGGMKLSGYGKESGKDVAVEEYLVSKTVTMTLEDHY
ncbi:putative succinate-semialdehyde dehydrogenase [Colletotrichum orbiculare MAFF 240422]|uniref:Succinate-semialdehyde dehydrogenase n=1 Tax=Colletotrichum orbiculare (strain 104-T / ATCC 96160 / CBS 514.97 / LARS 414 / MAFF 240422) TaxID=1213857 RepID=N4VGL0_COLOR|nr:putative succinate-semialdehyde dehydrogenase [Colletotrichum orbiculare MAFF 240422]